MNRFASFQKNPDLALAGVGGAAAAAFSVLAARSLWPRTIIGDISLRRRVPGYGKRSKKVAIRFGYLGKEWSVLSAAAVVAAKLFADGRKPGAAAILGATVASIAASHVFDATLPQKTPPPGRRAPLDPHFPSGHALHSASLLATAAWVLGREGKGDRKLLAAGAAVLALSLGVDRLIQDRHWPSDVVAGWLAAVAIAGFATSAYEVARKP